VEKSGTDFLAQWPLLGALVLGAGFVVFLAGKLQAWYEAFTLRAIARVETSYGDRIAKLEKKVEGLEGIIGHGHDTALDVLDLLQANPPDVPGATKGVRGLVKRFGDIRG